MVRKPRNVSHIIIIIIITIINDYCHKNFELNKIFQIRKILNPQKFVPYGIYSIYRNSFNFRLVNFRENNIRVKKCSCEKI